MRMFRLSFEVLKSIIDQLSLIDRIRWMYVSTPDGTRSFITRIFARLFDQVL